MTASAFVTSPCVNVCSIDPRTGLCLGCGRSLDEIARWTAMTGSERASIIVRLAAGKSRRSE